MSNPGAQAISTTRRADGVAVLLSALCLVHCLALPLIVLVAPVIAVLAENEAVHQVLVLAVAPITFWVAWQARADEGAGLFRAFAVAGVLLLCAAAFVPFLAPYEVMLTVIGALLLGVAHWRRLTASAGAL